MYIVYIHRNVALASEGHVRIDYKHTQTQLQTAFSVHIVPIAGAQDLAKQLTNTPSN